MSMEDKVARYINAIKEKGVFASRVVSDFGYPDPDDAVF